MKRGRGRERDEQEGRRKEGRGYGGEKKMRRRGKGRKVGRGGRDETLEMNCPCERSIKLHFQSRRMMRNG